MLRCLFFRPPSDKTVLPDSSQSAEWNRGAYLVQGLGHCGSCHTLRGIGFQEKARDQHNAAYLTGGTLEGWHAPDLTSNQQEGLGNGSQQDMVNFLKTGWTGNIAAFGAMTEVIEHSTQYLSDQDLQAIAVYLKSLKSSDPQAQVPKADERTQAALVKGDMSQPGAQVYMDNCAACHRTDGKGYRNTFPALADNPALLSDDLSSLVSIILRGSKAAVTDQAVSGLTMPDFAWRLDDQQVADLSTVVRRSWGNNASAVTVDQVKELRKIAPPVVRKEPDQQQKPPGQ
ncbi:cytochrome c [Erwinia endophytica]|uniref:c-type cytochrome n=1 Tax=Erwinia endophytica TaxID=1563158 RepID=UPI001265E624|nr:cytochrome c [Erwinia endophytica]